MKRIPDRLGASRPRDKDFDPAIRATIPLAFRARFALCIAHSITVKPKGGSMRSRIAPLQAAWTTALCLAWIAHPAAAAPPVEVTTCGQVVVGKGTLTGDLDCSGSPDAAVRLENGSQLDLAGFTITADVTGVQCKAGCRVNGPGTIRRVIAGEDHTVGVFGHQGTRVQGGVSLDGWRLGAFALGSLRIDDVAVTGSVIGAIGAPIRVTRSTFTGNEVGVAGSSGTKDGVHYTFFAVRIADSTFADNDIDITAYRRPKVRDVSCTTSAHRTIPATPYSGGDEWEICTP
jgi:hypothetical protein